VLRQIRFFDCESLEFLLGEKLVGYKISVDSYLKLDLVDEEYLRDRYFLILEQAM
jgi:hypothetical protein